MADDPRDPPEVEAPPPGVEDAEGARGFVGDAVRKAFLAGIGALFMTEEGARRLAREWKLPKEVLGYVTSQAAGAKDEVLRVVNDEVRKFFRSEGLQREFLKLLGSMTIEVHAEIRLKPAGPGSKVAIEKLEAKAKPRPAQEPDEGGEPA
jgi:hypothetical protein